MKPVTPRPKWNQQSVHSSAKPNSSLSSIHSSPLTPHPRLLIEKSVNQLRGTTTTSSIETRTKVSKDTTTLSFKQKLMMVNDENNPMNLKDDLINDKQTIQKCNQ